MGRKECGCSDPGGELPELTPLLPLVEDRPAEQAVRETREIIQNLPLPADVRSELLGVSYLIGLKYLLGAALNAIFREELPMLKEAGIIGAFKKGEKRVATSKRVAPPCDSSRGGSVRYRRI